MKISTKLRLRYPATHIMMNMLPTEDPNPTIIPNCLDIHTDDEDKDRVPEWLPTKCKTKKEHEGAPPPNPRFLATGYLRLFSLRWPPNGHQT